jgi:hypothetical protein
MAHITKTTRYICICVCAFVGWVVLNRYSLGVVPNQDTSCGLRVNVGSRFDRGQTLYKSLLVESWGFVLALWMCLVDETLRGQIRFYKAASAAFVVFGDKMHEMLHLVVPQNRRRAVNLAYHYSNRHNHWIQPFV